MVGRNRKRNIQELAEFAHGAWVEGGVKTWWELAKKRFCVVEREVLAGTACGCGGASDRR